SLCAEACFFGCPAVLRAGLPLQCPLGLANGSWSSCTAIYLSPVPNNEVFSAATQPTGGSGAPVSFLGGPHGQEVVRRQPDLRRDGFYFAPDVRAAWHGA